MVPLTAVPAAKELVLLGGGHSHIEVLRKFGMRPLPGVRLTLVTRDLHAPYSGMLPGFVSGFYSYDDCHIDLLRLARFANARLIHAEAEGIDAQARRILLHGRPHISYDVLSLNVGITPAMARVPGAAEHATPVKPIDSFVERFEAILARARASTEEFSVVVVGGGAGGVELAAALKHRLREEREGTGNLAPLAVTLVSRGPILGGLAPYARKAFLSLLQERGVGVREVAGGVSEVTAGALLLADGTQLPFNDCLWCTEAAAAKWVGLSGLPLDKDGFVSVNEFLQCSGGPENVFAAGDVASVEGHPRAKAGVFAVRAGPPLAENLRRYLTGQRLQRYVPQATHLSLVTAGDRYAVGVKGWLGLQGAYLWGVKDWIDRGFMRKYGSMLDFEAMAGEQRPTGARAGAAAAGALGSDAVALAAAAKMRCGGCGSKVGASTLTRVLQRLRRDEEAATSSSGATSTSGGKGVLVGFDSADDAAVLEAPPPGHVLVHSVDFFSANVSDPYLFGRITANHALGDIYAMGATPVSAMAVAVVPFASGAIMEGDLYQMMAGAASVLRAAGCALVGGHSCEGAELALGFAVHGSARAEDLLRKSGLRPGQALVLTKAVGAGAVMAAAMRGQARGRWVSGATEAMQQSNGPAAAVLRQFGATACTDVTGFGLLGHLAEMVAASGAVCAELDAAALPLLPGAAESAAAGALSSLHVENSRVAASVANAPEAVAHELWPLLVDPQTGGGLLASVPETEAEGCVRALRAAGYPAAAVVGRVCAAPGGGESRIITVKF